MGGSASSVVNPVAKIAFAPVSGGLSLIHSRYNPLDKSFDPIGTREAQRMARTESDLQRDAAVAQEADLKKQKKVSKQQAGNIALRNRLIALRGINQTGDRSGTLLTGPSGVTNPITPGTKTLLGT